MHDIIRLRPLAAAPRHIQTGKEHRACRVHRRSAGPGSERPRTVRRFSCLRNRDAARSASHPPETAATAHPQWLSRLRLGCVGCRVLPQYAATFTRGLDFPPRPGDLPALVSWGSHRPSMNALLHGPGQIGSASRSVGNGTGPGEGRCGGSASPNGTISAPRLGRVGRRSRKTAGEVVGGGRIELPTPAL